MKLVFLKSFDNAIDTRLFTSKLESEEIQCYIENEFTITVDPLLNYAIGGIQVKVAEQDFSKAFSLMQEYFCHPLYQENGEILICPDCSSIDIENNFSNIDRLSSALSILLALVFFIVPFFKKNKMHCKNCNLIFKKTTKY